MSTNGKKMQKKNGKTSPPPEMLVRCAGDSFVDAAGRKLTLRGVNLGGSSKNPTRPDGATHLLEGFFEGARTASFVNRPFALADADAHFTRLRAWGCNTLRFIITWEAVEHAGPGQYDGEYLEYLKAVVEKAGEYGMYVYIDPHQDVFSRFCGGDGAPAWTFEKVGLDVRAFEDTGAALVHQTWGGGARDKAEFPRMCWPTNLHKLACGTMFTLFWAGDRFAPKLAIDGVPVQEYLQGHYTRAMAAVAARLRSQPHVIGIGTMNEPLPGYVGLKRLDRLSGPLKNDLMPTPFEGMALGAGHAMRIGRYAIDDLRSLAAGMPVSTEVVNEGRRSAWLPGHECVWKAHGVWDVRDGAPVLLRPDYFRACDFGVECYLPFAERYAREVRAAGQEGWMLFVEMPPADLGLCTFPKMDVAKLGGAVVHAPHWYDQLTLFLGRFVSWAAIDLEVGVPRIGEAAVRRMRERQLGECAQQGVTMVGGAPTLIGEVGIPFDMHNREAYTAGQLANCEAALGATVDALEANNLSYTLWCYTADHTARFGDNWNREDLSLFSAEAGREVPAELDPSGVHLGGRALRAFVRPYAQAVAGAPVGIPRFAPASRTFSLTFRHGADAAGPTVVFVPVPIQYPDGFEVTVSDGHFKIATMTPAQGGYALVSYTHDESVAEHTVVIAPKRSRSISVDSQNVTEGASPSATRIRRQGSRRVRPSRGQTT